MKTAPLYALALLLMALLQVPAADQQPAQPKPVPGKPTPTPELIQQSVQVILDLQEPDGQWAYEGVVKIKGQPPVGYRVGGTALVGITLLLAAPKDEKALAAVERGLAFVLKFLSDPDMAPSTEPKYDTRVWGHACALDFLCHARAAKATGKSAKEVDTWIAKLVDTLITEEIPGGGWNYANRRQHASFVTGPVAQALLLARAQGEKVPAELLERARKALETSRTEEGAFLYSGTLTGNDKAAKSKINLPPGSAARTAVCETTLHLLGSGKVENLRGSVAMFHKHWDELYKRHQKPGTHVGEYAIAPYFFYYGHRYCAQAIELLPEKERPAERAKLLEVILKTRDADGSWNDRVFPRSRGYCSAMVVLALLADRVPAPPALQKKEK